MNKLTGLVLFFVFSSFNLFSVEIDLSWSEKIYDIESNGMTYKYSRVSEVEYNTTVAILCETEAFSGIDNVIFRLYYNENIMVLQRTIFVSRHYLPDYDNIAIECEIIAEQEYLKQMKADDTLYYKCSFEFPSGEIFESEPVKATFSMRIGTYVPSMESIESRDYAFILKSDDGEYYKMLNFKEDGYIAADPHFYRTDGLITLHIKFENLIPGKTYSLYYGIQTLIQEMPFYIILYI